MNWRVGREDNRSYWWYELGVFDRILQDHHESVREKLGDLHSAKSVMYSVDFAEIEALQHQEKWEEATRLMIEAARHVEDGGADFVIICTNTMHRMADDVQEHIGIPLLHIADATAENIKMQGLRRGVSP